MESGVYNLSDISGHVSDMKSYTFIVYHKIAGHDIELPRLAVQFQRGN
jgi:hypothetical protein